MKKVHLRQMVLTLLLFFNPWRIKKIKLTPQFFHILIFCECVWWFRRQKNYRNCCVIVIVPWVLIAFVHCLPRSPAVNLLISALIVKCVDYRAFKSPSHCDISNSGLGDFHSIRTLSRPARGLLVSASASVLVGRVSALGRVSRRPCKLVLQPSCQAQAQCAEEL